MIQSFSFMYQSFLLKVNMCNCLYNSIDWTAAAAIANFFMVYVTYRTLQVTRNDYQETKRQWKESMRPRIVCNIIAREGHLLLQIENVGNSIAVVTELRFNSFFKENLLVRQFRERFAYLEEQGLVLDAKRSKYFSIHPTLDTDNYCAAQTKEEYDNEEIVNWFYSRKHDDLKVECRYKSVDEDTIYSVSFESRLERHLGSSLVVCDNETDAVLKLNETCKEIKKVIG